MELNPDLTLKESLKMLNEMLKHEVDSDSDGREVIYISVDEQCLPILEKFYPGQTKEYLTWVEHEEGCGIDISPLWIEIEFKFKKDIWWYRKKGFRVQRWYSRLFIRIKDVCKWEIKKRLKKWNWKYISWKLTRRSKKKKVSA